MGTIYFYGDQKEYNGFGDFMKQNPEYMKIYDEIKEKCFDGLSLKEYLAKGDVEDSCAMEEILERVPGYWRLGFMDTKHDGYFIVYEIDFQAMERTLKSELGFEVLTEKFKSFITANAV